MNTLIPVLQQELSNYFTPFELIYQRKYFRKDVELKEILNIDKFWSRFSKKNIETSHYKKKYTNFDTLVEAYTNNIDQNGAWEITDTPSGIIQKRYELLNYYSQKSLTDYDEYNLLFILLGTLEDIEALKWILNKTGLVYPWDYMDIIDTWVIHRADVSVKWLISIGPYYPWDFTSILWASLRGTVTLKRIQTLVKLAPQNYNWNLDRIPIRLFNDYPEVFTWLKKYLKLA
jgi:hypothetical protein